MSITAKFRVNKDRVSVEIPEKNLLLDKPNVIFFDSQNNGILGIGVPEETIRNDFVKQGQRDPQGRSLRDFDLQTRMFKYPCSYLIYSAAFDGLPKDMRDYVLQRMWNVLQGADSSRDFAHLTPADRTAIREILIATKPNLPDYWK